MYMNSVELMKQPKQFCLHLHTHWYVHVYTTIMITVSCNGITMQVKRSQPVHHTSGRPLGGGAVGLPGGVPGAVGAGALGQVQ